MMKLLANIDAIDVRCHIRSRQHAQKERNDEGSTEETDKSNDQKNGNDPFSFSSQSNISSTSDQNESGCNQILEMEIIKLKLELNQCRRHIDEQKLIAENLESELNGVKAERDALLKRNEDKDTVISHLKDNAQRNSRQKNYFEGKRKNLEKINMRLEQQVSETKALMNSYKRDAKSQCSQNTQLKQLKNYCRALKSENDQMKVELDLLRSGTRTVLRNIVPKYAHVMKSKNRRITFRNSMSHKFAHQVDDDHHGNSFQAITLQRSLDSLKSSSIQSAVGSLSQDLSKDKSMNFHQRFWH